MLRSKLVSTVALLLVLAAPLFGAASTPAGPPPDEPDGRLAAALSELRDLVTALWAQPARETVTAAAESGGSGGAGGSGGEGQGSYDPNGVEEDPEPGEGVQTQSTGAAG